MRSRSGSWTLQFPEIHADLTSLDAGVPTLSFREINFQENFAVETTENDSGVEVPDSISLTRRLDMYRNLPVFLLQFSLANRYISHRQINSFVKHYWTRSPHVFAVGGCLCMQYARHLIARPIKLRRQSK